MATRDRRASVDDDLDGSGLRVGIVRAEWNDAIVQRLSVGASRGLAELGVSDVTEIAVPGCFEIPLAAKMLAASGTVDAIVVVGAVIRGETTHYELVSEGAASGVMSVQLATGIPIGFGLVTVENEAQALTRSENSGGHNVGETAAHVAVTMALLARNVEVEAD